MRRPGILEARDIFLYALTFFVAFWTARAALARGRNPWVWGGAALVVGLLPFDQLRLLSVAPVLYLMFFVRPTEQRDKRQQRDACSKCASAHSPGQNFCTKCGWDLSREYSPEANDTVLASEMRQPQSSPIATMERPPEAPAEPPAPPVATAIAPEAPLELAPEPAASSEHTSEVSAQSATTAPESFLDEERATEPLDTEADSEPEPAPRPWGLPNPGPAPTAEAMTSRGAALLSEGRLQEAIDQFTKAIALDPKHREAFEHRAEAYTRQGRGERAEEDHRRIQALNAGS